MIRGYSNDEKIDYRTGQIVNVSELQSVADKIFAYEDVASSIYAPLDILALRHELIGVNHFPTRTEPI